MGDLFCGWYFRCQSDTQTLAVIPAIHGRECSVQLITDKGNWNVPLPRRNAKMHRRLPEAVLESNLFSRDGLKLDLHTDTLSAQGLLRFGRLTPLHYDIMGPFKYVPFMECRHKVISMNHSVNGSVRINGEDYIFQNARGYIEGDRGRSFPARYAWSQCHLHEGSVMLSVADIPFGFLSFTGIICAIVFQGKEYRIASYLGASAQIGEKQVILRQRELELTARLIEQKPLPLNAPSLGKMSRTIHESVSCRAYYRFRIGGETIFEVESPNAAFEYEY